MTDVEAVETTVEFVDDVDPPYQCFDAAGNRVRLIVYALELLICQVVPDHFDRSKTKIFQVPRADEDSPGTLVECFDISVLRSLDLVTNTVEPASWDREISTEVSRHRESAGVGPREFHEAWMRARVGRRY